MEQLDSILGFWFGSLADANLPSAERTGLWFGANEKTDNIIREKFEPVLKDAIEGKYKHWEETPRGCLGMIILYDQLTRCMYRGKKEAFSQDQEALRLCLEGISQEHDHGLTLIERVFFYMPLQHSEDIEMQKRAIAAYRMLAELSLPELMGIFQGFLNYGIWHYEVIYRFGRFPERNAALGRESTPKEIEFLHQTNL